MDSLVMWVVMSYVNCHQKQVIHHILLQDWRNLRVAWTMPQDAGGTFLTRHCAAMTWFPHELIDDVTCCILHSCVSKLGNTGYKGPSHSRTAQKTHSLWVIFLEQVETKWNNVLWSDLEFFFQVRSEDWNDAAFTGQRIRWTQDSPNGPCIEVNQDWAIDELEEIRVEWNTEEELHCTPSMHTVYRSQPGQINWPNSRIQFQCCHKLSRCASMAASRTIGDVKSLSTIWRDSQWSFNTGHSLDHWDYLDFLMPSYNDDGPSQKGMTVFLAESRERSSRDGMAYGSLIDYERHEIKKPVISTTMEELYSFMKCFGSCQFLHGLWMDISSEVANINMRTDAKNLVTTARMIHLPEQKETIHTVSMLRKEACSGSIQDLAHIPTQNCLADCLTKATAKADNLITAVQTKKCLMLTFTLISEPRWNTRSSCQPGVKHFLHTREKEDFFLNTLKISLAPVPQEQLFQVMFVGTQQTKEQKELKTRESKGQDATKITAPAESCIQFLWPAMSMTALTRMAKNIPNRSTIEDFTEEIDEAGFVRQYNFCHLLMRMLCLCLALMNLSHSVAPPSCSLVTMAILIPQWVVNSDSLLPEEDRLR